MAGPPGLDPLLVDDPAGERGEAAELVEGGGDVVGRGRDREGGGGGGVGHGLSSLGEHQFGPQLPGTPLNPHTAEPSHFPP